MLELNIARINSIRHFVCGLTPNVTDAAPVDRKSINKNSPTILAIKRTSNVDATG